MCQYSASNGVPNDWHLVHLGSRAVGGAGLVVVEATAVTPEGRISPSDCGIWRDEQVSAFRKITDFVRGQGSEIGVQLAHAGRKASTAAPWDGDGTVLPKDGGWIPIAPSAVAFSEASAVPREMTNQDIEDTIRAFESAAVRSLAAGFSVVELHFAHGYLVHEFLSPLSNRRKDAYGGSFENRIRIALEITKAVRAVWPESLPLFARLSASDWKEGGWTLEESVRLSRELKNLGVDLIDCSSGGVVADAKIAVGPGYQVPFAEAIRREADIPTAAVGIITDAHQAEEILTSGKADAVFLARELLRDPYWPLHAAAILDAEITWPKQYERAKRKKRT